MATGKQTPLRFACPHCRKALRAGPRSAGKTLACPHCRQKLTVPAAPPETQPAAASSRSAPLRKSRESSAVWVVSLFVALGLVGGSYVLFKQFRSEPASARKAPETRADAIPAPDPSLTSDSKKLPLEPEVKITRPPASKEPPRPDQPKEPKSIPLQPLGKLDPSAAVEKDSNWFVCFPPNGQHRVPLVFPGNEVPDPLPGHGDKLAGYPITITFARRNVVRNVHAELRDGEKNSVAVWLSSPEAPANPRHPGEQANTVCLFAQKPLKPGTTYAVTVSATVDGQKWRHAFQFTTISTAAQRQEIEAAVLMRVNEYRRQARLDPVVFDTERTLAAMNHAQYLALNVPSHANLNLNSEDAGLPGYSPEGEQISRGSAIFIGGGPVGLVDWMISSFINRHPLLEPALRKIGLGYALLAGRGKIWVFNVRADQATGPSREPILFPCDGQQGVPTAYMMHSSPLPVPAGEEQHPAGYAITLRMPISSSLSQVKALLTDGKGQEVPIWLSTPEQPAAQGFRQFWIGMVPKEPLREDTTYTVAVDGTLGGRPWRKSWRFHTIGNDENSRAKLAEHLLARVNRARQEAGLGAVEWDADLSRGCDLHAQYLVRNFADPATKGLGMHNEDPKHAGYTPEGQRAGRASVIASDGNAMDSVESWLATLYHRVPLLHPSLKRIGLATIRLPDQNWMTLIDCGSDVRKQ